ncbi:flavoprotein [Telmatospirillum sp.]|uniref:flavoprotein n=1 Tax=Telmatospirillum sp. TaxID=2079197 RepID=UPI002848DF91|nr:flavoprotein [Telmatospirillum sp.]MDR3438610.1 flavoprotein [Telmatospirillum sp.]
MTRMDPKDLERAVYQAVIEYLAERVVRKLRDRRKCALALFTGTDLGQRQAVASLQALGDGGWSLRLVLSAGARKVLASERLRELEACGPISSVCDVDALLDGCEQVLVPALSINTAAKVAGGIRDSLASELLARALERGLPVVAASDGCCPDNPERMARGFLVADAYKARLRSNLEALQSYGIRLVRAADLAAAVQGAPARTIVGVAARPMGTTGSGEKRIFSRSDAVQCREGELRLDHDVLVTPAAADELRVRNVRLIQA